MTVYRLHEILGELIAQGHARKNVGINKRTFTHPLEDEGCVILPVESATIRTVERTHPDGGMATRADGTAARSTVAVLEGEKEGA